MKSLFLKIKNELLELIPPTLFFFVAIGLLMLTKRLMLQQYGITFSDFAGVVVGALIVGKVVLIADAFPFINKFPEKPLIYNVAWKTVIYVLAAFLVRLAEHVIPLTIKYGSFREAMARLVDETIWPHFWLIYLWLSVLLFVYCSLRELDTSDRQGLYAEAVLRNRAGIVDDNRPRRSQARCRPRCWDPRSGFRTDKGRQFSITSDIGRCGWLPSIRLAGLRRETGVFTQFITLSAEIRYYLLIPS